MKLRVARGANCCFHNPFWGRKVWLASTKADYVLALGLERFGLGINSQGCRFGNGTQSGRNTVFGVLMRCHGCHAYTVDTGEAKTLRDHQCK